MRLYPTALLLLAAPLAAPLGAQTPRALTADDYARAERFLGTTTAPLVTGTGVRPTWLTDGRFWYRTSTANGFQFITVDPARRTRASAFDQARLAAALTAVTSGRVEPERLPFQTFELSKDGRELTLTASNRRLKCDLQAYTCATVDTTPRTGVLGPAPRNSRVSPDGRRAAFISDYNLWVSDLATGRETQLTTDGVKDFGYATNNAGWTKSDSPVLTWSPDSKRIATFQHDGRGTSEMYLVSTNVGAPRLQAWKYPLPGDSVIFRIHRVVIDVDGPNAPRVVRFQMPPDQHRSTVSDHIACGGAICDLRWYPDGSSVAFLSVSRDHKQVWFRVADATTGAVRTLFDERSPTQIGDASLPEGLWAVLPASNELVWWSQRDNWTHLYLHDLTSGRLKHRITNGEGNVASVLRIDEKTRTIYFTANGKEPGRDPYFRHFYRVGLDGRNQRLLTPENANHEIALAPDGRHFVDTYSTPTTPAVSLLRDASGKTTLELEKADISRLLASGWKPPTPVTMKARDGRTDIYGLLFTPSRLDSTKKYPIVNYIYPGPQSGSVGTRSFSPARSDHQALAELGFVVVAIDGMGTPGRSKAFADAYYGRMGDNTLPDQVAGMRELAQRYKWIDIDRTGIWGHSGGGFATAGAMFRYPDFFKVGIAESGNHDNRNYEDDWGERYQGLLERRNGSDNYADEANQTHAKNLKGKLMLAHGGLDGNVPPYNTYLVVDALTRAGKDFDLVIFPNAGHGFGQLGNYMMRRRWDYFVKNLLGAEPPKEYEIGRQSPRIVP
ncbi:MAG: DPP IV N-terminal domain-containing protein [Gemmatimonadaceae bacterium]